MPNHCHNDLYIDGPKEQVDALLALIGADKPEPEFSFTAVIPYPEKYAVPDREMRELGYKGFAEKYGADAKDGFNSGGYEWCTENWGTKWGGYDVARRDYMGVCVSFRTAWCPPLPIVLALHKLFPLTNLHLEYFERGSEFVGGMSCISEGDWYDDEPWQAGVASSEWSGKYGGHRGG